METHQTPNEQQRALPLEALGSFGATMGRFGGMCCRFEAIVGCLRAVKRRTGKFSLEPGNFHGERGFFSVEPGDLFGREQGFVGPNGEIISGQTGTFWG